MTKESFYFELPMFQIFGASTTYNFESIKKVLGFWQGRKFEKMLQLLRRLDALSDWVKHIEIRGKLSNGISYEESELESLPPQPLPDESVIIVFYSDGRIDRFEVISGRLRDYCNLDNWPTFEWPVDDKKITIGDSTFLKARNNGSTGSLGKVLRIIAFTPIDEKALVQ